MRDWTLKSLRRDALLHSSLFGMATTVVSAGLGYVYWVVAARTYSEAAVGAAAALIALMTLAACLASLGIGPTLVQTLPKRATGHEWSLTLNAGLAVGIVVSLFTAVLVIAGLPLISHSLAAAGQTPLNAVLFVCGVPLWTVGIILDHTCLATRTMDRMLARNGSFAILKLILLALPVVVMPARIQSIGGISVTLAAWVLAAAASIAMGFWLVGRQGTYSYRAFHGLSTQVRALLASFAGHHVITIGGLAPMYLLPPLVTIRLSATDNAYFYTTWMLGSLFFMVSPAISVALFAEGAHDESNLIATIQRSIILIGMLLGPLIILALLGGRGILGFFGSAYATHGALLLTLLALSAVPDACTNVVVAILRVRYLLRDAGLLNLGMAILTMVLAWMLLPRVGIAGVGWAWLIAQWAGCMIAGVPLMLKRSRLSTVLTGVIPPVTE